MNVFDTDRVTLELPREDFDVLLYALGIAIGAARGAHNHELSRTLIRLTNRINEGNPNFTPYSAAMRPEAQ